MPSLRTYRQRVAYELGGFYAGAAGATSTTAALVDTTWPIFSSLVRSEAYRDWWLYRPDAANASDRERLVKTYAPLTGTLSVDRAYTAAPAADEVYELHAVVQPSRINALINQALRRLLVPVEFDVVASNEDARRICLSTGQAWLTNPEWVCQAGYLTYEDYAEGRDEHDPFRYRPIRGSAAQDSAGAVYLEHPGRSFTVDTDGVEPDESDRVYLRAMKPAYHHCCAAGGTLGDQDGLTLDTDVALPDEEWVTAATMVEAWRQLGQVLDATANAKLAHNRQEAASWLSYETMRHYHEWPRTLRAVARFGPAR
jgi:hypothetical protein